MPLKEFEELIELIKKKGTRYKKRYGQWIRLKVKHNRWLVYDTFGEVVSLDKNQINYTFGEGFGGEVLIYMGQLKYPYDLRGVKACLNLIKKNAGKT